MLSLYYLAVRFTKIHITSSSKIRNVTLKKLLIIALCSVASTSCVKLELNPGNLINDTIEASKDLYKTVKRNSNGEEERIYNHSIPSHNSDSDVNQILQCHEQIKSQITASKFVITEVISESSKIEQTKNQRAVNCSLSAIVKPLA